MLLFAKIIGIIIVGTLLLVPVLILALLFLAQIAVRFFTKVMRYRSPVPSFIGPFLDSDIRRAFQGPEVVLDRSGIHPGQRVLEIGCGSGAYTAFVARRVGQYGAEYALDVQPAMLKQLEAKLSRPENRDIRNVTLVESDARHLPFRDNMFDLVFMVSVLQQIPDAHHALQEIGRVLKPGGTLAITEIMMDPYYSLRSTTRKLGMEAGFAHEATLGNAWHYTVRFKKPSGSS